MIVIAADDPGYIDSLISLFVSFWPFECDIWRLLLCVERRLSKDLSFGSIVMVFAAQNWKKCIVCWLESGNCTHAGQIMAKQYNIQWTAINCLMFAYCLCV